MSNRLIHEKSPYLLQHSHNPVDWYPWGAEAFEKAKAENKPVFLSVGYSTCHWCHVMENESFEDEEVAAMLNNHFVSIKVDKEERPDIDAVYMNVCQALTGSGGWPMTIIMTPDQKPFFAGTYFPKESYFNGYGLMNILKTVSDKWQKNKQELLQSGDKITQAISKEAQNSPGDMGKSVMDAAKSAFEKSFDPKYGGFGSAPKFPTPHNLMFLLRYSKFENDPKALAMAEKTLEHMFRGGMFDHLGGGFSRYSTDPKWLAPHFEKMLYDNALLAIAYLEAYQFTGKRLYAEIAEKVLDYVRREMTDEEGGFYCAQDADSEGVEGKYYLFTPEEAQKVLGEEDGDYFNRYYDITPQGNFEGKSIPNRLHHETLEEKDENIGQMTEIMYKFRLVRTKLNKDDKILTAWNALMITALAKAFAVLGDSSYLTAAQNASSFIENKLSDGKGNLMVRYRGEASGSGYLDDYSFFIWSLISLYEATFEPVYLEKAILYANQMTEKFEDKQNGGFYLTGFDSETLIIRTKETYDGAIPSGNSVAGYVLEKLAKITGESKWQEASRRQLAFLAGGLRGYPAGYSFALIAGMQAVYPSVEIVCVTQNKTDVERLQRVLGEQFLPNVTVIVKELGNAGKIENLAPFIKDYVLKDGLTTYYLCKNHSCSAPVTDLNELKNKL